VLRESLRFSRRALGLVWKASAPLTLAFALIALFGSLLGPALMEPRSLDELKRLLLTD
jgi:ABC-type polysaccharide/polyol phosphate export permease